MTELVLLRLDPDIRKRLDALAVATERSRADIAAQAVKQHIDLQEWQIAAIKKGVLHADRRFDGQGSLARISTTSRNTSARIVTPPLIELSSN